jgi:ribosomal protein S18 acetylase RimI-like enzyme
MRMTEISAITVRPARRGDVAAIIAMLADDHLGRARERVEQPLPQSYFEAFDRITRDANLQLVVAEDAGRVVGCLQLALLPGLSSQGATRALVEDVRVATDCRSRGIGEQLLQWAIGEARARRASLIELLTHESRVDAQRFYARLGFARSHVGMVIRF